MTSADRPIDLSDQIGAWLRTSLSLAETARIQGMVTKSLPLARRPPAFNWHLLVNSAVVRVHLSIAC